MVLEKYLNMKLGETTDLPLNAAEIRQRAEAMSPGVTLTIRTFTDGNEVVLAVQDQGCGIEPDVLEKIDTPFFTTKDNGTGLGLAVCYSIAARHNAVINIEIGHTCVQPFPLDLRLHKHTSTRVGYCPLMLEEHNHDKY